MSASLGAPPVSRIFNFNPQLVSFNRFTVQAGNGCAGFVPFHLDQAGASALAGKDIGIEPDRSYGAVLGKKCGE